MPGFTIPFLFLFDSSFFSLLMQSQPQLGVRAFMFSKQMLVAPKKINSYQTMFPCTAMCLGACLFWLSAWGSSLLGQDFRELEVKTRSGSINGLPISWGSDQILMLRSDGWLAEFPTQEVVEHRLSERNFRPAEANEMAQLLQAELGPSYRTAVAGPFLIIAPGSSLPIWSERFLALYGGFQAYCAARHIRLRQPPFLMPALVFRTREEYEVYSQRHGHAITASTLGYYSLVSNRIALYEFAASDNANEFFSTASTLIHEATHQAAYNTGIHDRLAEQPLWTIEGLAMLFEAPGIYDSGRHPQPNQRVNRTRLLGFRQFFPDAQSVNEALPLLITDDKYFERDSDRAYCLAWALTYYLSERYESQYSFYLQTVSSRGAGSRYPAEERFRQFEAAFGNSDILARDLYLHLK
jgi:hypothetical protein